jgi:hypothetical protein
MASILGRADCVATAEDLELSSPGVFVGRAALSAIGTGAAPEPVFGGTDGITLAARGNSEASF